MKFPLDKKNLPGLTTNSALLAIMLQVMVDKAIINASEAEKYFEQYHD